MKQLFFFGASCVYGVGASDAGFADIIKQLYHRKMYGDGGVGESYEVFTFGKSGATIDFVSDTFEKLLKMFQREEKSVAVLSIGFNNTRATDRPDKYDCTTESYKQQMSVLLDVIKHKTKHLICLGYWYVDEAKTAPEESLFSGSISYFYNERIQEFNGICKSLCMEKNITFVTIPVAKEEWLEKYLYDDGLHPNQKGHQLIADTLLPVIEKEL